MSPYPALKAAKSSHMPALVQYAEAEAILRKVQETSLQLENNLNLVLQSRHELDTSTDQTYVYGCKLIPYVTLGCLSTPAICVCFSATICKTVSPVVCLSVASLR